MHKPRPTRGGDVLRADRRAGRSYAARCPPTPSLQRRAARRRPRAHEARPALRGDPRRGTRAARTRPGLRLRAALRAGARALPRGAAGPRARQRLLLRRRGAPVSRPLVELRHAAVRHAGARRLALEDLSLELFPGEFLAVTGESGSGKSTLVRALARHLPLAGGQLVVHTERRRLQLVFQDPYASLDPRQRAGPALGGGLALHRLR